MSSSEANIHLSYIRTEIYNQFHGEKISSILANYSRRMNVSDEFILTGNRKKIRTVNDIEILGMCGVCEQIKLYILLDCNDPFEKENNNYKFIITCSVCTSSMDFNMVNPLFEIKTIDDILYCSKVARYDWNTVTLLDAHRITYLKRYPADIIITHSIRLHPDYHNYIYFCKYDNLLTYNCYWADDAIYPSCGFDDNENNSYRIKCTRNVLIAFQDITHSYIIDRGNSLCKRIVGWNETNYEHNYFSTPSNGDEIKKFIQIFTNFFVRIISVMNDSRTTYECYNILKKIYNTIQFVFANKITFNDIRKELNVFCIELYEITNVIDMLNDDIDESTSESISLPILILRHVVYEHTLLLYRKSIIH